MAQKEKLINVKALQDMANSISVVITVEGKPVNKEMYIAYLMRCCNASYAEIGEFLNSSRQYAHQIVEKMSEQIQP